MTDAGPNIEWLLELGPEPGGMRNPKWSGRPAFGHLGLPCNEHGCGIMRRLGKGSAIHTGKFTPRRPFDACPEHEERSDDARHQFEGHGRFR